MKHTLLAILLTLPALAQTPPQLPPPFTLHQAMSAPFVSSLIGSPHGHRFAWIANQQGRRNLWIAEPTPHGNASRPLTHFPDDDGLELSGLTWAPDGESLFFVRGGDAEFEERPAPNPAELPGPIEQTLYRLPIHGGEPIPLGPGHSPAVSPDGVTLAFLLKDQIWILDLLRPTAKSEPLFHGRGSYNSLTWSPDSRRLAFVSSRGDHGFIGTFTFASKTLAFLDPATEHDQHPVWSPDSSQIAFIRLFPDALGVSFKPRRTAQPWSIRVVNADGSNPHELWHASPGPGSVFHETVASTQLLWSSSNQIAFPWEADGFLHLYAIPAIGGKATLLTPGNFEVEHVLLAPEGIQPAHTILYSSNQYSSDPSDQDRRHLWSVPFTGALPTQLTHGTGSEVSPAATGDTIALISSTAQLPGQPATLTPDGQLHILAPQLIPPDFPAAHLVTPQPILFRATDGMQIHAQLFLPPADAKPHPALVFFHGGSRRQMLLGWHYMQYYHNTYAMNQYLAALGYVVLSVNYRSGIGYGLNFREALDYGAGGASEFRDVEGAGLYLQSRPDVDPARIGVWGGSYGGYLTALALARSSDLFAAGVDLHGVHDWNVEQGNWAAYDPSADLNASRIAWESSPLYSVKQWRSPVLLMQGDDDRNVQFSQTVRLAAALRQQGVPFEEHVFPDEIHDFLLFRSWMTAYTLAADFFNRRLAPAAHP